VCARARARAYLCVCICIPNILTATMESIRYCCYEQECFLSEND